SRGGAGRPGPGQGLVSHRSGRAQDGAGPVPPAFPRRSPASRPSGATRAGAPEWGAERHAHTAMEERMHRRCAIALVLALTAAGAATADAQQRRGGVQPAPARGAGEGEGPFERLIIRGATVVDGTGAPPVGPVDIVVEGNRNREVRSGGYPGLPIRPERRPHNPTLEIDAHGMYVLPGFVDLHAHIGGAPQGTPAEYVYKLWLAHGVTTIRDPGSGNGVDWTLSERERSAKNEI